MVPEVEERDSALFTGYNWREWIELPYEDRVDGVAYYRLKRLVDIWEQDAVSRETDRRVKQHSS